MKRLIASLYTILHLSPCFGQVSQDNIIDSLYAQKIVEVDSLYIWGTKTWYHHGLQLINYISYSNGIAEVGFMSLNHSTNSFTSDYKCILEPVPFNVTEKIDLFLNELDPLSKYINDDDSELIFRSNRKRVKCIIDNEANLFFRKLIESLIAQCEE